jgi:hypothetical protein
MIVMLVSIFHPQMSPVWDNFSLLDPALHPQSSNLMVCLVCRDLNVDKTISLGKQKNLSPTALLNHLRQHEDVYQQYLDKKSDRSSPLLKQTPISVFLTSPTSAKDDFKFKYSQWIIEQGMPF